MGGLEPDQAANPLQLQYGEAERFRSESFTPSTVGDFNEGRYTTASLEAGYNAVKVIRRRRRKTEEEEEEEEKEEEEERMCMCVTDCNSHNICCRLLQTCPQLKH